MKPILYYIFIGCMVLCFASCSTSTKFTVYGEPGTQVLTPDRTTLATIDNTGMASITNPDDNYYAFLLAHKPGTEDYIPFALDYDKRAYPGSKFAKGLGIGIAGAGAMSALFGGIMLLGKVKDVGVPLLGAGAGALVLSLGIVGPASSRSNQTNHKYCYKYTSTQKTNQDLLFTKPNFEQYRPETPARQDVSPATSSKAKKTLPVSLKTLKENASKIAGTYTGEGTLTQGNDVIETYNSISVSVKRESKDIVLVNVIESDGSKFFASDGEYDVKKQSDGKYILTLKGISNATIEIDTDYNLTYIHPRVNIDGEIYKLKIKAKK